MSRFCLDIEVKLFKVEDRPDFKYYAQGLNINPGIVIKNLPPQVRSITVMMDSKNVDQSNWLHWLIWNLPATNFIHEGEIRGVKGLNDFGTLDYYGFLKCSFPKKYTFRVFGMDRMINFDNSDIRKFDIYNSIMNYGIAHGKEIVILHESRVKELEVVSKRL